jgi:hypothetical protein
MTMTPTSRLFQNAATRRYLRRQLFKQIAFAALATIFVWLGLVYAASPAEARGYRHHHHYSYHHVRRHVAHRSRAHRRYARLDANGNSGSVIGGRPAGCPHASCGCVASLYIFGRIIPDLNLAANWIRKFPRTAPAPRMAAARNHHVMILMSHAGGSDWLVHDGNSGHGLTREHVRSIAGYVIVNPNGSRMAAAF